MVASKYNNAREQGIGKDLPQSLRLPVLLRDFFHNCIGAQYSMIDALKKEKFRVFDPYFLGI